MGRANQRSQGYNVAIWAWSADNTVIESNEAYGTKGQRDGEGFDSDWNCRNTVIQYNYSHDNDGGFLLICNDGGQLAADSAGNVGTVVRYNISQNDRTRGINLAGPIQDSLVYNNTIYVGKGRRVDLLLYSDWAGWAERTYFYNNIFDAQRGALTFYGVSRAADGAYATRAGLGESQGNVFDSNVYFGIPPAPEDARALTADPKLTAPGEAAFGRLTLGGYGLEADSPARGAGKSIENAGGRDFWGSPVPSCGGTDRGAIQYKDCK